MTFLSYISILNYLLMRMPSFPSKIYFSKITSSSSSFS